MIAMGIPVDLEPETEEEVKFMELSQQDPPRLMQLLGFNRKLAGSGEPVSLLESMMILFLDGNSIAQAERVFPTLDIARRQFPAKTTSELAYEARGRACDSALRLWRPMQS